MPYGSLQYGQGLYKGISNPIADFLALPRYGNLNLEVQFTNLSENASTYLWDFGDSSPLSSDNNPLHKYISEGIYTVSLSAFFGSDYDIEVKTSYIIVGLGHIGAFYFGPVDETITPDILEISAVLLQPTVNIVNSKSVIVTPTFIPIYVTLLQPTVYTTQDIKVDFVGVPRRGVSPLTVDFTAIVNLGPENINKYQVKEYQWCFDYDYTNNVCKIPWVTTTQNPITHVYIGYAGQQYSVKCCVTLKLI